MDGSKTKMLNKKRYLDYFNFVSVENLNSG